MAKQVLTKKQAAMKIHKRVSQSHGFPKCGSWTAPKERERVIKPDWRRVTCKNCLKQKK